MARTRWRGLLLCEDAEHDRFFRRLLEKWFGKGKIRVERIPNRQGAGDQFVMARYAREVQIARRKKAENYALVLAIDGDNVGLRDRLRQLDQRLTDSRLPTRGADEMIVIFVPTRNIETWELWLCGHRDVGEVEDYKARLQEAKRRGTASVKTAVATWFGDLSPQDETTEAERLPSLSAGRNEVKRLDRPRN